jgi:hypothetical protein
MFVAQDSNSNKLYESTIFAFSLVYMACELTFHWAQQTFTAIKNINFSMFLSNLLVLLRVLMVSLLIVVILAYIGGETYDRGYESGCNWVFSRPFLFTIYSNNPTLLPGGVQVTDTKEFQYVDHSGFMAKDYLIIFDEVDSENHRVKTVYYLPKKEILSFSITESWPSEKELRDINNQCKQ